MIPYYNDPTFWAAVFAAVSIIVAILVFFFSRLNQIADELRSRLSSIRINFIKITELFEDEIPTQFADLIIRNEYIREYSNRLFSEYLEKNRDLKEIDKYVETSFKFDSLSFECEVEKRTKVIFDSLDNDIIALFSRYPALYRVVSSIKQIFYHYQYRETKEKIITEEIIQSGLNVASGFYKDKSHTGYAQFAEDFRGFLVIKIKELIEDIAPTQNDLFSIFDLVYDNYVNASSWKLSRQNFKERKTNMAPLKITGGYEDDFMEAFKAIFLSKDQKTDYKITLSRIKNRGHF